MFQRVIIEVILVDANYDSGIIVADRIVSNFYSLYTKGGVILHYDIQEMQKPTINLKQQ